MPAWVRCGVPSPRTRAWWKRWANRSRPI
jgi:hypothetical protein